ncbi:hypothetical protein ACR9YC_13005 [Parasphingorhabdus sp. DH2-15]|uniref:hypothetical protein n=1 Tax=Parasphingorhabdus sp. DH2-15 TaxID=3444112 RepID=UPI003F684EBF
MAKFSVSSPKLATVIAPAILVLAGTTPLWAFATSSNEGVAIEEDGAAQNVAGISVDGLKKKEIKTLNRYLANREAGDARQCIRLRQVRRTATVGDDILIYEMRGGDILVNRTRSGCNAVGGNAIINSTPDDRICNGQIFEVRDPLANIPLGSCAFGEFVQYDKVGSENAD